MGFFVRTTIDVNKDLLGDVVRLSGEKNVTRTVSRALAEYVRRQRAKKLIAALGTHDLDLDDWYEFRHQERT